MGNRRNAQSVFANIVSRTIAKFALIICVVSAASACGRSQSGAKPASTPLAVQSQIFGDTARFGLRVLGLDPVNESAEARLARSSYLVLLAVRPGRDIELIEPAENARPRARSAGRVSLLMQRFEQPSPDAARDANPRAQLDYDRCVARVTADAERAARDRSKRGGGSTLPVSINTGRCGKPSDIVTAKRMPAREPAERYLVVLASDNAMSYIELYARLGTLTATAPDIATTIEAIAAGLYVDKPGTFAGSYIKW